MRKMQFGAPSGRGGSGRRHAGNVPTPAPLDEVAVRDTRLLRDALEHLRRAMARARIEGRVPEESLVRSFQWASDAYEGHTANGSPRRLTDTMRATCCRVLGLTQPPATRPAEMPAVLRAPLPLRPPGRAPVCQGCGHVCDGRACDRCGGAPMTTADRKCVHCAASTTQERTS